MTCDEPDIAAPDAVAIIGMAGRFPGASDVAQFWRNLAAGIESVAVFDRAALAARGVAAELLDEPGYVRAGAVLDGIEMFDADFFGIPPREAELTDPQHRVFLECAWEALEDSGYDPEAYGGQIGVFAGAGPSTYLLHCLLRRPEVVRSAGALQLQLGNNKDYVPLRVSYKLGLRGPSINVNTACSTSLVAVHLACQSLLDHQCDMALAGGVGIQVPQDQGYLHAPNGILSPDGHCRAFDARAQGTVGGNGAGIVVLKRLAEALEDGDAIRAVIIGSAINNDGDRKVGFTAPSVEGQARVIAEALGVAGIEAGSLGYIEAHGTGTPLGDPIEVAALKEVFRSSPAERQGACALGSVKTNIGHLDEAAGVAGLIKAVLALQHGQIPPSLHFERPNPELGLEGSPFRIPTRLLPWETAAGMPRRAGVSSFGIGGTNAHAMLQQAPPVPMPATPPRPWQLLLLSARSEAALEAMTSRLADHLRATAQRPQLADVAHTLQLGRKVFPYRRMVLCRDLEEAVAALDSRGPPDRCVTAPAPVPAQIRPVVFLFPGQGSQHVDMGLGVYRTEPAFRDAVDRCARLLEPELGLDLRQVLYPGPQAAAAAAATRLDQTALTQPALFTIEYALAQLLMSWGIRPAAMCGHSIGEYVAACLAGVFSLEDGLRLVAARGRMMQAMPPGGMLAVELTEAELLPLLGPGLTIALANAPTLSVVAGSLPAVAALEESLSARGIGCRRLQTSHAFHSEAMDPVLEPFVQRVRQVSLNPPAIPFVSNLTGRWITAEEATDPDYWARHLRSTVRFSEGIRLLLDQEARAFLEVGPGRTLGGLVRRQQEAAQAAHAVISTMRHPQDPRDDAACLLEAAGRLWLGGACRKLVGLHAGETRRRLPLPTYPFERRRFWIDPPSSVPAGSREATQGAVRAAPATPDRAIEDWFQVPTWQRRSALSPADARMGATAGDWLVFADECGLGARLVARLRTLGRRVVTVEAGPGFEQRDDDAYLIDPRRRDDYDALFERLAAAGDVPRHVAHLWSVAPVPANPGEGWDAAQAFGLHSLLFLVQAAGRRDLADGMSLHAVSSHMQAVEGTEASCPERATLLGLVRVAPQEYPGLRCRSIDLVQPDGATWSDRACLDPLLATLLLEDQTPAALAVRDGAVWEQSFAPLRLPAPSAAPACLREGGSYLITGGLGSMGLAIGRYLARERRARVALLGRTGLPATDGLDFDPGEATDLIRSLEAAAEAEAGLLDIDADARLQRLLRAFCAALIGGYFREAGIALQPGRVHARAALRQRLRIVPAFDRLLDFLLRCLAEDGVIALEGDRVAVLDDRILGDLAASRRALLSEYTRFEGLVRLLEHCASGYGRALSGEVPSISVLYPDGTAALLDECGRHVPAYARDGVYLRTAAGLVAELAAHARPDRPLRVLEVGGGTGGLTRAVLAALQGRGSVEYTFTDLGPSFVRQAEQAARAGGVHDLRFGVLDIARDPQAQGFPRQGFDLVLGYNVVHATRRVAESVGHLRSLLAPGGVLMLVETTRLRRWDEMVWGLTEGWWHFADEPLRTTSPLLGLDAWEDLLRGQGFAAVTSYPREGTPARRTSDVGLLIARKPPGVGNPSSDGTRDAAVCAALDEIRDLGGEVLVLPADVADEARMRVALSELRDRFGALDGVIHAAGILGPGLIHDRTPADLAAVLAPKAGGLLVLDALLQEQGMAPDLMVLCSSMASVAPIVGQVGYGAANAFLDAYAACRSARRTRTTVSISWGFWQELGMIEQAGLPAAELRRMRDDIRDKGRAGAGIEAFRRILAAPAATPHVLVAPDGLEGLVHAGAHGGPSRQPARYAAPRHPWLEACLVERADAEAHVARLGTGHWVLDEHRPLRGKAVLPGTAFLELARAALETHGPGRAVELRDVYFLAPLVVEDGETREVRTILQERGAAGFEFVVVSRVAPDDDAWLEHARGEIAFLAGEPPPLDLAELELRCQAADIRIAEPDGSAVTGADDDPFAARVRRFTPHWRSFERVRLGAGQGLASLHLAAEFAAETGSLAWHPALADMATGFLSMADGFEAGVPFCYRRVRLWRPLPPRLHSHVRAGPNQRSGERSYNATLVDDDGAVLAEVVGFTLKAFDEGRAAEVPAETVPAAERNFCAEIGHRGSLSTLGLRPAGRRRPGPGEVEIEVAAAGLNFIEVLYALGLLPEPPGGDVRFGLECAGRVAAVGEGVTACRPGDQVFGFAAGAIGRFATTAAAAVALMPEHLSPAQAATLPAAFTTAYYALITRGRLRRGERVLIHAASGGVGLAAVNIAQWRGAEIHATAGSPEKREHLRSLGIPHVWDSRSLEFAGAVLDATGGRGVDVVLNSLGGEFIPASLSVLARHGRFLELGKRDIFASAALSLAPFERHLSFMALDVGPDMPDFGTVWAQVVRRVRRGEFLPLPYREFAVGDLAAAFEHMAQARHIGKVVVAMTEVDPATLDRRRARGRPLDDILGRETAARPPAMPRAAPASAAARPAPPPTDLAHARPALATPYRAPGTGTEAEVAGVWEELLGVSGIGADDNFFEMRGDSLLAAQVTSQLYAAFGVRLPLSAVFEHPTVAGLATRIEQLRRSVRELATAPAELGTGHDVEHEL